MIQRFFTFFCLILISSVINAQDRGVITIQVNHNDRVFKFHVINGKESFRADTAVEYYWFASNDIQVTQGGFDGKLLHGAYFEYYTNNNLNKKGDFSYGVKDGEWRVWHENGQLKEISNWRKGKKDGYYELRNENGKIIFSANFKANQLNGKVSIQDNGVLVTKKYKENTEIKPKVKRAKKVLSDQSKDNRQLENRNGKLVLKKAPSELEKKSFKEKLKNTKDSFIGAYQKIKTKVGGIFKKRTKVSTGDPNIKRP